MSVRKRTWTTRNGEKKESWVVDYADQTGKRRLKTFPKKKEADTFAATANVEVRAGVHVADSQSKTVSEAGKLWLASAKRADLERSTTDQYQQHLDIHINPKIGEILLTKLNAPRVRQFEDHLRDDGMSAAMVPKVMRSLGSLLADAQERGLIARNPVRDLARSRRRGKQRHADRRQKGKLKIGVDIPSREEIKGLADHLSGRWRPLILTAIFTGLRASELRGLRWQDIDFDRKELHVRQRADRFNVIGRPKSEAGERSVPLPPLVLNSLREWKLVCPKGDESLVFPNGAGNVETLGNIINRGLVPAFKSAGVVVAIGEKDATGAPVMTAKYTGMHSLRHFYASWCINPRSTGGLELPVKVVQERLGHSSITMTMDTYGHLFPRADDTAELATAEASLLR